MLLAASESAVTKKPRLRLISRRSSSVSPCGFFQVAMSRFMFRSCGIQWLAQPARYLSQAHLYLNGTSWLTSVLALMTRLSSARTRVKRASILAVAALMSAAGLATEAAGFSLANSRARMPLAAMASAVEGCELRGPGPDAAGAAGGKAAGVSSQVNDIVVTPKKFDRSVFVRDVARCCCCARFQCCKFGVAGCVGAPMRP